MVGVAGEGVAACSTTCLSGGRFGVLPLCGVVSVCSRRRERKKPQQSCGAARGVGSCVRWRTIIWVGIPVVRGAVVAARGEEGQAKVSRGGRGGAMPQRGECPIFGQSLRGHK